MCHVLFMPRQETVCQWLPALMGAGRDGSSSSQTRTQPVFARRKCICARALENAIITAPEAMDPETRRRLHPLLAPYMEPSS